jgi:hypothetical protein
VLSATLVVVRMLPKASRFSARERGLERPNGRLCIGGGTRGSALATQCRRHMADYQGDGAGKIVAVSAWEEPACVQLGAQHLKLHPEIGRHKSGYGFRQ